MGIDFLNPGTIAEYITYYNIDVRIKRLIETDKVTAEKQDKDRTYIHLIMLFKYGLGISKVVFIIMTICYFLGTFWQVFTINLYYITKEKN